ncbi:MAG TPA: M23 family metallopeptidase [Candidatus Dormibacteraeota bacterium]|nr:M23 family metallopeptidase [Candidatus Dormibacteraeota bacterium]
MAGWQLVKGALVLLGALAVLAGAVWWFKLEPGPPRVEFAQLHEPIGRTATGDIVVRATGHPGLRYIEVRLVTNGQSIALHNEELPATPSVREQRITLNTDLAATGAVEGPAKLEVVAGTYAWHILGGERETAASKDVTIDTTPPRVDVITTQNNMRLGGSSLALFRVSPDATDVAVNVDQYTFPAVRGYFADPSVAMVLFAVPQDLTATARPVLRAVDAAGNVTEVGVPVSIKNRQFPERQLQIDDAFLQRKVPEILSKVGKPVPADLVQGYLVVNRDVRKESEDKLDAITAHSADVPLWTGVFHRQTNTAPMSAFADRRSYIYKGETIDKQTHLGYDLASLKRASVEATQAGVVLFAGYLGIYGDTVVIDHGLGVASLYGHLSSIGVKEGQKVAAGEIIGQTGETGLAGGDHLHFSILLRGVQVDPLEWWDPKWMREHLSDQLASLPAAKPAATAAAAPAAPATGTGEQVADGQAGH